MIIILFVFSFFIARMLYSLEYRQKGYAYLHMTLGILVFLLVHFISSIFIVLASTAFLRYSFINEIVISCFTIPFAVFVSGVYYKVLESWLKKNEKN